MDILVDAGCDPRCVFSTLYLQDNSIDVRYHRIRNKAKVRPIDLVDPRNKDLRATLQKAEMAMMVGNDVVIEDDDDGRDGPGSESD